MLKRRCRRAGDLTEHRTFICAECFVRAGADRRPVWILKLLCRVQRHDRRLLKPETRKVSK